MSSRPLFYHFRSGSEDSAYIYPMSYWIDARLLQFLNLYPSLKCKCLFGDRESISKNLRFQFFSTLLHLNYDLEATYEIS